MIVNKKKDFFLYLMTPFYIKNSNPKKNLYKSQYTKVTAPLQ